MTTSRGISVKRQREKEKKIKQEKNFKKNKRKIFKYCVHTDFLNFQLAERV